MYRPEPFPFRVQRHRVPGPASVSLAVAHEVLQKVPLRVVLVGGGKQMAEDPSAAELPDELV